MQITPLGDTALLLELGSVIDESTHKRVQAAWEILKASPLPGVIELIPSYTAVTLLYDPQRVVEAGVPEKNLLEWLSGKIRERLKNPPKMAKTKARTMEIPICYGGEFGPDLAVVARFARMSPEEVIKRHSKADYLVYLIGFAPGFPYLGGLSKELAAPRRSKPRMQVPPGSVGIAGKQTGIYPLSTPGGWNLIGRTPLQLFKPRENPPVLLRAGDRVKFRSITADEFLKLQEVAA